MALLQLISRKIGAQDIAFGNGAFSYTDSGGVSRVLDEVNATHIPTSDDRLVDSVVGDWITIHEGTSLAGAISSAGSSLVTLYLARGTHPVPNDLTSPANVVLRAENGALITVSTGATLTVNGTFEAGIYQVFSCAGTGAVAFGTPQVAYAQWWATNTTPGTTDMSAAWQAAVNSGAGVVDGAGQSHKIVTAVQVTASGVEIRNASPVIVKPSSDPGTLERYGFAIAGTVTQKNVTFRNLHFTGSGWWGGIFGTNIYRDDKDAGGVVNMWGLTYTYPTPNPLNYTTCRKNIRVIDCDFTSPVFESVFTDNCNLTVSRVKVTGSTSVNNANAVIEARFATDVIFSDCEVDGYYPKAYCSGYVDGIHYNNLVARNSEATNNAVGFYFGEMNVNCEATNCSVLNAGAGSLFMKTSYFARNISINGGVFNGDGYALIQGSRYLNWMGTVIETTNETAIKLLYHSSYTPSLDCYNINIDLPQVISTEDGSAEPKVVDLGYSHLSSFKCSYLAGNVYAYPAYDLTVRDSNIYYTSAYATPLPAVYFRQFDGARIINNKIVNDIDTNTVYGHGNTAAAALEMTGNTISNNSTASTATSLNFCASGRFIYEKNTVYGTGTTGELAYVYTDATLCQVKFVNWLAYSGATPVGNVTPLAIGQDLFLNNAGTYSWWRSYGILNTEWLKMSN